MSTNGSQPRFTNYVAYTDSNASGQSRIGHLDVEKSTIQPLSFSSGAPLANLYQVCFFLLLSEPSSPWYLIANELLQMQ